MGKPAAGMPIDGGHGENILLIRLKSLGDILFVLPALNLMRDNFPHARITFLVSSEYVPLLRGFAAIDSVIPIDRAIYRRKKIRAIWSTTLELVRRLRREKFTLVVDFQGYGETAWLTWLTGARRRWGYVYRPGSAWAYTRGVKFPEKLHPVHRNLSLPTRCGVSPKPIRNEFLLTEAELRPARSFFQEHGLDPARPTLFIQPFTSTLEKNWPLEKFLSLAGHWRQREAQVIFGGGPMERESLRPAREAGFPVAAGAPLLAMAGLMKLCTLVIGGDTGLIHLAVAMGKRVYMLALKHTDDSSFPYGHPEWVVEASTDAGVADIEVSRVVEASEAVLREHLTGARAFAMSGCPGAML